MPRIIDTPDAPLPFSAYAQAVEVEAGARTLHISGQVGALPDGTLLPEAEAQHEQAWRNVFAILAAADMGPENIVDVTGIVTTADGVPLYRAVRDRMLGGHRCGSTLLVCGLAHPGWQVEIAVRAAR